MADLWQGLCSLAAISLADREASRLTVAGYSAPTEALQAAMPICQRVLHKVSIHTIQKLVMLAQKQSTFIGPQSHCKHCQSHSSWYTYGTPMVHPWYIL